MICSDCRRETEPARFCTHCGARLGSSSGPGSPPESGTSQGDFNEQLEPINREIALTSFMADEIGKDSSGLSQESRRSALQEVDYWQADLLLAAARIHRDQGQWALALAAARRTLGLRPGDADAKYICGLAYQVMGQADDATSCFHAAIDARPGWAEPRVSLADLYESQSRPSEAIRELRDYARVTNDITLRERARSRAATLTRTLPQYGLARPVTDQSTQPDTPQRLTYALDSVEELHRKGVLSTSEAEQLRQHFAQRRQALGPGSAPPPRSMVRPERGHPAAESRQERPVYPGPSHGWSLASFLTALLSERNLHAMLYVGAMLLLVSSVAITAISWDQTDAPTEWGVRQSVLTFAGALFFCIGHIIRTSSPTGRSAGALLTMGALWVPIAVGHIVYRFIEPQGETFIPGLTVALDLPTVGWLIIAAAGVPAYALLALRFQLISMAAAAGLALAASLGLALALADLPGGWDLALMTALGPVYVWISWWARRRDSSAIADGLSWLAHLGVPATFLALIAIQPEGTSALALTAWSAVALYALSRFYHKAPGYEYALGLAIPTALLLTLSAASSIDLAWYAPALAAMGALYLGYTRLAPERPGLVPFSDARWRPLNLSPYYATGLGLILASLLWAPMWAGDAWAARIVTLYGAAAVFGASYRFQPPHTPVLAYLSAGLLAVAAVVTLGQTSLPVEWYGLVFALLSAAYIFVGGRIFPQSITAASGRLDYLLRPHLLGGWVLSAVALAWLPMWTDGADASRIATLYASVVIYGASAYLLRPRAWFLVFLAGAVLPAAFFVTVIPWGLAPTWYGLVLVPFVVVYWLAAEVLRDFPRLSLPRYRLVPGSTRFIIDSPSAPLYLLAIGISLAVPVLSVLQPWVLAASLFTAAGFFSWPAWVYRRSVWLFPGLAATHLGLAQVLYLVTDGSWNLSGVYFGGMVVVVWSAAAWLARQRRMETIEAFRAAPLAALTEFWTVPVWGFAVVGMAFSLVSSMLDPQTGLAMAMIYGVLTGTLAVLLRREVFAYGSLLLILGIVLPTSLWAASVQLVHAPLYTTSIALAIGVLFYQAGRWQHSTWRELIWAVWSQPVRLSALALIGAGFAVSLTHASATYESGIGSGHFRWFAVVLAGSGLSAIWWAFVDRNLRLTYLGAAMVGVSYMILLGVYHIGQPLFYVAPAGIFMMAVAYAERRWGEPSAARTSEIGGLALLLGATLGLSISEAWQFYGEDSHFYYGVWLFFSSLAIFLWGGMMRWKWTFLAGVAAFVANFFTLLSLPVQLAGASVSWWWIVLGVAVLLIGGAAVLELRREQVLAVGKDALERLEAWS